MAWILHAADDPERHALVRRALAAHDVNEAADYDEAVARLDDDRPYDLAIVDLDTRAAELLQLLRARHPDIRRIVVAAAGTAVVEKYGVEELLLASDLTVPAVRYAVQEALDQRVSPDARIRRAELWRRYQDWRRRHSADLDATVRAAELYAGNTAGTGAEDALAAALQAQARFLADADQLAVRITRATDLKQTLDAAETLSVFEELY